MTDLTNPIFTDENKAREHLEAIRWLNGAVCPHCGAGDHRVAKVKSSGKPAKKPSKGKHRPARAGLYYCNSCKEQFTVQVGTVLEKSHIPLNKWLAGFYLMCASKKGVSAHQLHRTLGVSYKSAWFMAHRIREAMRSGGLLSPMGGNGGTVEIDETYIGSKPNVESKGSGMIHKFAVFTLVSRDGEARSFHMKGISARDLLPVIRANISRDATVMTDAAKYYKDVKKFAATHESVNHKIGEYVRGPIHTNTIEGYFSIFKRGMRGVYQHCSEKHLHRYLAEFDFRYSNRIKLGVNDEERTARAIKGAVGKRLTYRRPVGRKDAQDDAHL